MNEILSYGMTEYSFLLPMTIGSTFSFFLFYNFCAIPQKPPVKGFLLSQTGKSSELFPILVLFHFNMLKNASTSFLVALTPDPDSPDSYRDRDYLKRVKARWLSLECSELQAPSSEPAYSRFRYRWFLPHNCCFPTTPARC